jgi:hypothetical protein
MPRITISYRREETGDITGRIFDRLVGHYGRGNVFRDIDSTPAGRDFDKYDRTVFGDSDVVLAVIGPRWASPRGRHTKLSDPTDPVRVEIETALQKGVFVLPVLVMRAEMPSPSQVPEALREFCLFNALSIDSGQDFDIHVTRLIRAMDAELTKKDADAAATADPSRGDDAEAIALLDASLGPAAATSRPSVGPPPRRLAAVAAFALGIAGGAALAAAIGVAIKPAWLVSPAFVQNLAAERTANLKSQAQLGQSAEELAQQRDANVKAQAQLDQTAKELALQKDAYIKAQGQVDRLTAQVNALTSQLTALQATSNRIVAFNVPNNPKPGMRDMWSNTAGATWIERSSDGKTNEFHAVGAISVEDCPGARLVSDRPEGHVEVFIPDPGCSNMSARILTYVKGVRGVDPYWGIFGKMEDIVTAGSR